MRETEEEQLLKNENHMSIETIMEDVLNERRRELKELATKIHSNPELGLEERKAVEWQKELLTEWGFDFQGPVAGLDTAYKASWGEGAPTLCFISEYDALPVTGHACGHNLIALCGLTCGLLMKTILEREKIPGRVVVMGTPGEEGKGGKVIMVRNGVFDDVDAALEAHPFYRTIMDPGCLSVSRYEVDFYGYSSHASVNPEEGKNALDAVMLMFQGINAWRQHLPEDTRVHGIVTEGGAAPNIIPDYAGCLFYLRALDRLLQDSMYKRFENIVKGAALMTETKWQINKLDNAYDAGLPNKLLNEEFYERAQLAGLEPNKPRRGGRVSTDFGNVSQIIPSIHVYFGITDRQVPLHSLDFNEAAGTDTAYEKTLTTAQVLCEVAYRFYTDAGFRERVRDDFEKNRYKK